MLALSSRRQVEWSIGGVWRDGNGMQVGYEMREGASIIYPVMTNIDGRRAHLILTRIHTGSVQDLSSWP